MKKVIFFLADLGHKFPLFFQLYNNTCPSPGHMTSFHDNHTLDCNFAQRNHGGKLVREIININ